MKTKRSMWMALLCAAGAGLLVTNCTVKSDDDCDPGEKRTGCICDGDKSEGYQVCSSEGIYGGCECSPQNVAGGSNAGGGGASAGETSVAGQGGALGEAGDGGVGGEAGVGGEGGAPAEDCVTCLVEQCGPEFDACAVESEDDPPDPSSPGDYCLSKNLDGSGQIEKILSCIDELRKTGVAKREAVRSCGASLGASSSPTFSDWPPPTMTPTTEQVMNCMADAPTELNPGAWAGDDVVSTPWVDGTCAKLACTSAQLAQ